MGPEEDLHARPAAQSVKAAKGFSSEIVVVKGEREDAQEAVDALAHLGGGVG